MNCPSKIYIVAAGKIHPRAISETRREAIPEFCLQGDTAVISTRYILYESHLPANTMYPGSQSNDMIFQDTQY